jgi:hypothetical protein
MRKNNAWGECDVGVVFNHSPITGKGVFGAIEERGPSEVRVPERLYIRIRSSVLLHTSERRRGATE